MQIENANKVNSAKSIGTAKSINGAMKLLKVINVVDYCQNQLNSESSHSVLAMAAAKKMRRVRSDRSREKTGHKICQHLLDMLAEDEMPLLGQSSFGQSSFGQSRLARKNRVNPVYVKRDIGKSEPQGDFWKDFCLPKAENDLQFSLSL